MLLLLDATFKTSHQVNCKEYSCRSPTTHECFLACTLVHIISLCDYFVLAWFQKSSYPFAPWSLQCRCFNIHTLPNNWSPLPKPKNEQHLRYRVDNDYDKWHTRCQKPCPTDVSDRGHDPCKKESVRPFTVLDNGQSWRLLAMLNDIACSRKERSLFKLVLHETLWIKKMT